MVGSPGDPPPAPDPVKVAQAQTTSNKETAIAQALLNQVNETTPFGSSTFNQIGTNQGIPQFERVTTLTPTAQKQLESQQAIGLNLNDLAGENIDSVRSAQRGGLNFEGLPETVPGLDAGSISQFQNPDLNIQNSIDTQGLFGIRGDFAQQGQELEQATFDRGKSLLEPQFGRQQDRAEVRLSERGLPLSSEAGGDILNDVRTSQGRQLNELALSSVSAGRQEQQRLFNQASALRGQQFGERAANADFNNSAQQEDFGQALATQGQNFNQQASNAALNNTARQQGFQERAFLRNLPLNDIAALLGTAPGINGPQFSPVQNVGISPTDVIGAQLGSAGIAQDNFNTRLKGRNDLLGGLFQLGATGAAAIAASDIRLKENIVSYGWLSSGFKLYKYNYINDNEKQIGVMAQEVEKIIPEAVMEIGGYKAVNYGMI